MAVPAAARRAKIQAVKPALPPEAKSLLLAGALLLPAAASAAPPPAGLPQLESGASYLRAEDHRVAAVGYRLALSGLPLCTDRYPLTGLLLHHLAEYDTAGRQAMLEAFRLDQGPGVLTVVENSPASRAGLRAGDILLAVNALPFTNPRSIGAERDPKARRRAIEASEAQLEAQLRRGAATLTVARGGERLSLSLAPVQGCPARVRLARSNETNAVANRGYVIVTDAMLRFTRSDDELAIVLAHELAHNILDHQRRLDELKVPRGLLRGFGKNASRVRATEEEADRLGIRLAWAAGYDVGAAIPFWRRLYAKFDTLPQLFRTHPGIEARERLIAAAIEELRASNPGAQRPKLGEGAPSQR